MKIGIDSYCYHRFFGEIYPGQPDPGVRWDLTDFTDHVRSLPAEALALETCFLPDRDEQIIRCAERFDADLMFAWGHPDGFMGTGEEEAIGQIRRFLELSARLGIGVMRIAGSSIKHFQEPHEPQIELTLKRLERVVPMAEAHGVKLALENHCDFFMPEILKILETIDSPFLGVCLDTGNCLRLRENPAEAVRRFGKKVFAMHAKDLAPLPDAKPDDPLGLACVPAGLGITDFEALLHALHGIDYAGMLLIEISRLHPDYVDAGETSVIEKGLNYLRRLRDRFADGGHRG